MGEFLKYASLIFLLLSIWSCQRYKALGSSDGINIDGLLEAHELSISKQIAPFKDIYCTHDPHERTEVYYYLSEKGLYVFAQLEDHDILTNGDKHAGALYLDDCFEIFFDPIGKGHDYVEIHLNPKGQIWAAKFSKPLKSGGSMSAIKSDDIKRSVRVDGTLNNLDNYDKGWSLELFIPFDEQKISAPRQDARINFARVHWPKPNGVVDAEYYSASNCTGKLDLHLPDKWMRIND